MSGRPKFLYIKKFRDFQHYHTRGAPWIKLYAALLEDAAFLSLAEAAQAQLMKLWLLASQFGHPLPNNPKLIAGKIGATGRFHLQAMIDAGFLIPGDESASTDASGTASTDPGDPASNGASATHARVPERGELRDERSISLSTGETAFGALLSTDADRDALSKIVAKSRDPHACIAALSAILSGNDPATRQPTSEQLGAALRDFAANGEVWAAALFRGYLKRAMAPPPAQNGSNGNGSRGTKPGPGESTYRNADAALEGL